jgi:methionyl-tRNA formyltransferase
MRIIFMGTPDFAVASLKKLVEANQNVVAVITVPDKPSGRGLSLAASPVKQYAISQNIPVLQPEKLRNPEFIEELASYQADLQIVVAFRMLPEIVWAMPLKGTFNLHGSLLPQYRGAAPINWAVMNGETETGATTFFIEKEIDTGNIIFAEKMTIGQDEDAGSVHDRMMEMGADLVLKTVKAIESGSAPSMPQVFAETQKPAPKLFKETCEINWGNSATEIHNFVRGLSPYPTAWMRFQDKIVKVFKTSLSEFEMENCQPGDWQTDHKTFLVFKTKTGWIAINELQMEGKKRLKIAEFLMGYRFV